MTHAHLPAALEAARLWQRAAVNCASARRAHAAARDTTERARSARHASRLLRARVGHALVWARLMTAWRQGTAVIAGGATGDGRAPRGAVRVVLIVDDHADTRAMYAQFLGAMGFTILEATTCAQALAACARGGIDAVVLDRRLPDGDGAEICQALKAGPRALRVVLLSGRQPDGATGADTYLVKPVLPDELCGHLERLLTPGEDAGA
jgi:CheY-like chemotaxis protein